MINSSLIQKIISGDPVLIAEIGVNYYEIAESTGISLVDAAKLMIKAAVGSGVDAAKFQSYKASSLAATDSPAYWDLKENPVTSQRELFSLYDKLGEADYRELAGYAVGQGVEFLSTAFDYDAADYLNPLMSVYKISSSDITNTPFIRYQASFGKPCILSTGAATLQEIRDAVSAIREVNSQPLVLMHCVLRYPTPDDEANLSRIATLSREFPDCYIGYSDHTKPSTGCDVFKLAHAYGARVFEKHFTLDKTLRGNDHFHAMDPLDAVRIRKALIQAATLGGSGDIDRGVNELQAVRNARRSLVTVSPIPKGSVITRSMLTAKRPGTGLPPSAIDQILGKVTAQDIPEDTVISPEMLL